ncbi:MAG: hypothetical protein ACI4AD_05685 [Roseburia sp.]
MMGQDTASSVIYMEVEGIKIAIELTKDAIRLAWQFGKFLVCSIAKSKYAKTSGKTNRGNFFARANGQAIVPCKMDKDTFQQFKKLAKKAGILYIDFKALKSGNQDIFNVIIMEKDLAMFQEILSQIKEKKIKDDVKNGMSEEEAHRGFDENNRTETMEEFAENVGATTEADVFDADMKEEFGEEYGKIYQFPKQKAAGVNKEKVNGLADIIQFTEWKEKMEKDKAAEIHFVYDEKNKKSQIVEQTETHIRIEGENLLGENGWKSIWVPKTAITPPLDKEPDENGMRKVVLRKEDIVVISDPVNGGTPEKMGAEEITYMQQKNEIPYAAEKQYEYGIADAERSDAENQTEMFDITINKETLLEDENEQAVKTRVPGTWGKDVRYLWINKKDIQDVYGGASMLTALDGTGTYKLYDKSGDVAERVNGKELFQHYSKVDKSVRKNASGAVTMKGRGRTI